eukprot:403371273
MQNRLRFLETQNQQLVSQIATTNLTNDLTNKQLKSQINALNNTIQIQERQHKKRVKKYKKKLKQAMSIIIEMKKESERQKKLIQMYETDEMQRHGLILMGQHDNNNDDKMKVKIERIEKDFQKMKMKENKIPQNNVERVIWATYGTQSHEFKKEQADNNTKGQSRNLNFQLPLNRSVEQPASNLYGVQTQFANKTVSQESSTGKQQTHQPRPISSPQFCQSPPTIKLQPVQIQTTLNNDTVSSYRSHQTQNNQANNHILDQSHYNKQNQPVNTIISQEIQSLKQDLNNFTNQLLDYTQKQKIENNHKERVLGEVTNKFSNVKKSYNQMQNEVSKQKLQENEVKLQEQVLLRDSIQMDQKLNEIRKSKQMMQRSFEYKSKEQQQMEIQQQREKEVMKMVQDRSAGLNKGEYYREALNRLQQERNAINLK